MLGKVTLLFAATAAVAAVPPVVVPLADQKVPLRGSSYQAHDLGNKNKDLVKMSKEEIFLKSPSKIAKEPCEEVWNLNKCMSKKDSKVYCNGIVDKTFKCDGKKMVCCIPDAPQTYPEVTCPPCRTETHYTQESFPWYWTDPNEVTQTPGYWSRQTKWTDQTETPPWWTDSPVSTEKPCSVFTCPPPPTPTIPTNGCSEEKGFFRMPHPSNQCFKFFDKPGTWYDANTTCHKAGLVLARPLEMINLRSYLVLTYGFAKWAWLDGRGNGTCIQWNRGPYGCISADVPLWYPGQPRGVTDTDCLLLLSTATNWKEHPEQPLWAQPCSSEERYERYPLCELVLQ